MVEAAVDIFWLILTIRLNDPSVSEIQVRLIKDLYPPLVELLVKTEESAMLKSGADCLTAIVRLAGSELACFSCSFYLRLSQTDTS